MDNMEFVTTIEEKMKDPLSPASFSQEIVEYLSENGEPLEGDEVYMQNKIEELIKNALKSAIDSGDLKPGEEAIINFAVRDPNEGDTTILVQTEAVVNENGEIKIENHHPAHIVDEDLQLVHTSLPPGCEDIAKKSADAIISNLGIDPETDDFLQENENNYTMDLDVFSPR